MCVCVCVFVRLWFSAAEEAMVALFHVHPSPDMMLSGLVAALYDRLYPPSCRDAAEGAAEQPMAQILAHEARLCRLLFALGQGAVCAVVYTEKLAGVSKKERDRQAAIEKDARAGAASGAVQEEADSMEAEMGMAAAADADHEQVRL